MAAPARIDFGRFGRADWPLTGIVSRHTVAVARRASGRTYCPEVVQPKAAWQLLESKTVKAMKIGLRRR